MTVHGGDVWNLGIPPSQILDFSANINPRGLPAAARNCLLKAAADAQALSFYPDPSAHNLRFALARYTGCPYEAIVVGPGAESLLAPILRYLAPQRALVPIPAFSEYRRVCALEKVEFIPFPLLRAQGFQLPLPEYLERLESSRCDLALITNPHNPTGALLTASEIGVILASGVSMILDEAFIDYAPHQSLVREAASKPGLVVIRSLTKFFGCPALRVGYAVAHPDTIQGIQKLLPTWPVTQMAMDTLAEAVVDLDYAKSSLCENAKEREQLSQSCKKMGLTVFPSAANYLFIELPTAAPQASELRLRLLEKHKVLIRNCDSYEGLAHGRYIRVAVRSRNHNQRLVHALGQELSVL